MTPGDSGSVIVTGLPSDAHTWNLLWLQLALEERGYTVVNLGPCVPVELLLAQCRRVGPTLVAVGSVNGHGHRDGLQVITRLRADPQLAATPVVIGGKLGIGGCAAADRITELIEAGYDAVFDDGLVQPHSFSAFLAGVPQRQRLTHGSRG